MASAQRQSLSRWIDSLVIALILMVPVTRLYGQVNSPVHHFGFHIPWYAFLDGSEFKWKYSPSRKTYALGMGVDYQISIGKVHHLATSASYFYGAYYDSRKVAVGEIHSRTLALFELTYGYLFLQSDRWSLICQTGINFRLGNEEMVMDYPRWFEVLLRRHYLRDLGLHAGIKLQYDCWKRLQAFLSLGYATFPLRYDHGKPPNGWGNGSTWQLVSCRLGLALRLNSKKTGQVE